MSTDTVVLKEVARAATSADMARAISLRGVFAACGVASVAMRSTVPADDFECPWEELPADVQAAWLTLAAYVDKLAHTPGWSGSLGGAP